MVYCKNLLLDTANLKIDNIRGESMKTINNNVYENDKMIMWKRLMIKVILIIRGMINDIRLIIRLLTLKYFFLNPKGWRPYPFCHAKRQSDLLGGWVGKNMFIMTFCVTNWFQRIPIQKKNT